jgi:hypothetical protein
MAWVWWKRYEPLFGIEPLRIGEYVRVAVDDIG